MRVIVSQVTCFLGEVTGVTGVRRGRFIGFLSGRE